MAILAGDVKLVASQRMDDVPEGGGAPTSVVIPDGASNTVFSDISEADRAIGRLNLRKVNVSVQTENRDTFLGVNVIVAEPPDDPNVAITIFKADSPFDVRTDAQDKVESYAIKGPLWSGYLLENHVAGMRQIQIFQRPGGALPPINRTLALTVNENTPSEVTQYIRVTKVESEVRTFTQVVNEAAIDFQGEVVSVSLADALRYDFPGSAASRTFAPAAGKTIVRDTTVADAGRYAGVVPLDVAAQIGDTSIKAESVYTQLVPSARSESSLIDQRPAAERALTLATTPRTVEVALAPHTFRIKVGQENRGYDWVQILRPFPAPGTFSVSFLALGNWYTAYDDGNGKITGPAVGTVNYTNGSIALTLNAMPDVGSSIIFTWGEASAFTNRSASGAQVRQPEFGFELKHISGVVPGSVTVTWESAGVLKTATAGTNGQFTGDATGEVHHATGRVLLRPTAMIDAGGEFSIDYEQVNTVTETLAGITADTGGFATIPLAQVPLPGSVSVRWVTVRNVSNSTGALASGSAATKTSAATGTGNGNSFTSVIVGPSITYGGGGGDGGVNTGGNSGGVGTPYTQPDLVAIKPPVELPREPAATEKPPAMMPGGSLSDRLIYVITHAVQDASGVWTYNTPKADANGNLPEWTQAEYDAGQKTIDGTTYLRWGSQLN